MLHWPPQQVVTNLRQKQAMTQQLSYTGQNLIASYICFIKALTSALVSKVLAYSMKSMIVTWWGILKLKYNKVKEIITSVKVRKTRKKQIQIYKMCKWKKRIMIILELTPQIFKIYIFHTDTLQYLLSCILFSPKLMHLRMLWLWILINS